MNKKQLVSRQILIPLILVRIVIPLMLFLYPQVTIFLNILFDSIDGQLYYLSGIKWSIYNKFDKILDYWWYIFLIAYIYKMFPSAIFIAAALFLVRTIGQVLGIAMGKEFVYLLFPNIFEWFCIGLILFNLDFTILLVISIPFAFFIEWLIHLSNAHIVSKYIFKDEIRWKK